MTRETAEWLNTNTLIGFTEKRGKAWHYREELQGEQSNHYVGPVPVEDVQKRLFNFKVAERRVAIELPVGEIQKDGTRKLEWVAQDDEKAMCTDDDNTKLGMFKSGYQGHDYNEWLINNIANLLDDDLAIGSAGLLRNRGVAWVSVEIPDNIVTPEGVEFRPFLMGTTSFDGTSQTIFKEVVTNVVCDNTRRVALGEAGQVFKVKHTKNSHLRISEARQALGIVHEIGEAFAAEVAALSAIKVDDKCWSRVKDILVPVPVEQGMGRTMAENKRNRLDELWNFDCRVAPWSGTGWGVAQALNTWFHHDSRVKSGVPRGERNMENTVSNKLRDHDLAVVKALELAVSN